MLLAWECSSKTLSVALFKEGACVAEHVYPPDGVAHSEKILKTLEILLDSTQTPWEQISALAVSCGPGSFTSIRVGMATALGFAYARPSLQVHGVSTLQAMAYSQRGVEPSQRQITCVIKAGRGRIYAASYCLPDLSPLLAEGLYDSTSLIPSLKQLSPQGRVLVNAPDLLPLFEGNFVTELHQLKASHIGGLALIQDKPYPNLQSFSLRYLQEPDLGARS